MEALAAGLNGAALDYPDDFLIGIGDGRTAGAPELDLSATRGANARRLR